MSFINYTKYSNYAGVRLGFLPKVGPVVFDGLVQSAIRTDWRNRAWLLWKVRTQELAIFDKATVKLVGQSYEAYLQGRSYDKRKITEELHCAREFYCAWAVYNFFLCDFGKSFDAPNYLDEEGFELPRIDRTVRGAFRNLLPIFEVNKEDWPEVDREDGDFERDFWEQERQAVASDEAFAEDMEKELSRAVTYGIDGKPV